MQCEFLYSAQSDECAGLARIFDDDQGALDGGWRRWLAVGKSAAQHHEQSERPHPRYLDKISPQGNLPCAQTACDGAYQAEPRKEFQGQESRVTTNQSLEGIPLVVGAGGVPNWCMTLVHREANRSPVFGRCARTRASGNSAHKSRMM